MQCEQDLAKRGQCAWSVFLLLVVLVFPLQAQTPAAPQPDPLMSLLLSQPKIDITSPVSVEASFDPPVIRPGEESIYRVAFNALEESVDWPTNLDLPPGLSVRPGAHGQLLQIAGGQIVPHTIFISHVRATSAGDFTLPQFTINVYGKPVVVPAASLQVTAIPAGTILSPQRLALEFPSTNAYAGQALKASVLLPMAGPSVVQSLAQVQLNGEGFLVDQSTIAQRIEPRSRGGSNSLTYIYETRMTPIANGKVRVWAQGFVSSPRVFGTNAPPVPQYNLLDSEVVELQVRPLPHAGELPGFMGAIGSYAVDRPQLSTNLLQVGEPLKLRVKVRGEGNLARLVPPPVPRSREWQVFAAKNESPQGPSFLLQGFASFLYTLVPLTEKAKATPAIPFCYFDPNRGRYVDLTIAPVPVTVKPGAAPADLQALLRPDTASNTEKEPVLSDLAPAPGLAAASLEPVQQRPWFPLVQVAPALAFAGLWGWDRRRRHLEQHPEIVLRRRARRSLRREWRTLQRAARTGDAVRFANSAANAMRIACAPHYPAEPRALVGQDVLALLSQSERGNDTGELVRRLFAVTDASRFAATAPDVDGLLALRPEIERVLRELEERL